MDAQVIWKKGLSFDGAASASGFTVPLGTDAKVGGDNDGFRPMELIAVGLAGCTGMDVISILRKKRQEVTGFEVKVHADVAEQHHHVFTKILIEYVVTGRKVDPAAVERAASLSETTYCPAQAMLAKAAQIERKITIREA